MDGLTVNVVWLERVMSGDDVDVECFELCVSSKKKGENKVSLIG